MVTLNNFQKNKICLHPGGLKHG